MSGKLKFAFGFLVALAFCLSLIVVMYVVVPFVQEQNDLAEAKQVQQDLTKFAQQAAALGIIVDDNALKAAMADVPTPPASGSPFAEVVNAADVVIDGNSNTITNTVQWSLAGPAPQTAEAAATILQTSVEYLTAINVRVGDPLVIGWKVGKPPYNEVVNFTASLGVCLDYPTSSGSHDGTVEWAIAYEMADWTRALLTSNAVITSPETTVYWTVCNKDDGGAYKAIPAGFATPLATSVSAPTAVPAACNEPTLKADWERLPEKEGPCAWLTKMVSVPTGWIVPNGAHTDTATEPSRHNAGATFSVAYEGPMTFRWE